ncbi:hypothetical protein VOLCADRAFT_96139 [Volvox carteri f. nagariensis]|uniref:Uncharacterized protein n=1 Tax=Volvox carteri f. nagariensis TaxID=3068 RepID=D8U9B3_VOLCA|nr:uncharacterized protein VOLCADRAFT_96139 [Volvox carteri f. nagariensis]EFJ43724.1 hypothetical protein VOLCADRAFT_96139 [Volvox carteri f. nagariensis]|eukprot:XP_002955205.1 hypothetical protein VOLCADRAFT_96139 [Volvox carteri f. nagariensis]
MRGWVSAAELGRRPHLLEGSQAGLMAGDQGHKPGEDTTEAAPKQATEAAEPTNVTSGLTAAHAQNGRDSGLPQVNGITDDVQVDHPYPGSVGSVDAVLHSGTIGSGAPVGVADPLPGPAALSAQENCAKPLLPNSKLALGPAAARATDATRKAASSYPATQVQPQSAAPSAPIGASAKPGPAATTATAAQSAPGLSVPLARARGASKKPPAAAHRSRSRSHSALGTDGGDNADSSGSDYTLDAGYQDDSSDQDYLEDDDDEDYEDAGSRRRRGQAATTGAVKRSAATAAAAGTAGTSRRGGGGAAAATATTASPAAPERKKPKWAQPLVRPENDRVRSLRSSQPPPAPKPSPPPPAAGGSKSKSKSKLSRRSGDDGSKPRSKSSGRGEGQTTPPRADGGDGGGGEEGEEEARGRSRSRGPSSTREDGAGSGSESGSGSDVDSDSDSESGSGSDSDVDDPSSFVRDVAEDAARSATAEVSAMWEFAAVLEFLSIFRGVLCGQGPDAVTGGEAASVAAAAVLSSVLVDGAWSADLLVDELVHSVGAPGSLLSRLHLGLLQQQQPPQQERPKKQTTDLQPQQQQQAASSPEQPEAGNARAGDGRKGPGGNLRPKRAAAAAGSNGGGGGGGGAGAAAKGGGSASGSGALAAAAAAAAATGCGDARGPHCGGDPLLPFWAEKGHEWRCYAALHPRNRVLALKLLCDLRLEQEDLKGVIDGLLLPPRPGAAAAAAAKSGRGGGVRDVRRGPVGAGGGRRRGADGSLPPAALVAEDIRKRPMGHDSGGAAFWVVGRLPDLQMRLYREQLPIWPKYEHGYEHEYGWWAVVGFHTHSPTHLPSKGARGGGGKGGAAKGADGGACSGKKKKGAKKATPPYLLYELPPEAIAGRWELLGVGPEGLGGAAEEMRRRSKKQQDRDLAEKISTELVSVLVDEIERRERKQKLAAKLRFALGSEYYETRSRRTRKEVDYSTAAYDKMLHEALRGDRLPAVPSAGSKRPRRGGSPSSGSELAVEGVGSEDQAEGEEEEEEGAVAAAAEKEEQEGEDVRGSSVLERSQRRPAKRQRRNSPSPEMGVERAGKGPSSEAMEQGGEEGGDGGADEDQRGGNGDDEDGEEEEEEVRTRSWQSACDFPHTVKVMSEEARTNKRRRSESEEPEDEAGDGAGADVVGAGAPPSEGLDAGRASENAQG